MWSREQFDTLVTTVPFTISVDWDVRPSRSKYGHVNALLAVLREFHARGAIFGDPSGRSISALNVAPLKRKLTDLRKRRFSIVGHSTNSPLIIAVLGKLQVDIYFNQHLFVEAETTYRQYFPSASVILQPHNFLTSRLVPSPGSWGSDITSLTCDWQGMFILEAAESELAGRLRHNFRGYKLAPVKRKLFLVPREPPASERQFLKNNGFTRLIFSTAEGTSWPILSREVTRYIDTQCVRLNQQRSGPVT